MSSQRTLRDLNLMDRFLFDEAMDDPESLETVLRIILGEEINLIGPPQTEKELRSKVLQKYVRLDVWAQDEQGNIYDAEVQQFNTHNLPKRTRYYHSVIDNKLLPPGEVDYNKLNCVYVIMIIPFDLFGNGHYVNSFSMRSDQEPYKQLGDEATTIFLYTRGNDPESISEELVALLQYFEHSTTETVEKSGSARLQRLNQKVDAIRANEEIGVKYMLQWEEKVLAKQEGLREGKQEGLREGKQEGLREGKQEGREEERFEVARRMLMDGMEPSLILKYTGTTQEELDTITKGSN